MTAQLIEYGKALPRPTPPAAPAPPRTPEAAPAPAGDALAPGQANASAPAASDPAPDPAANLQKTVNEARDNVATAMAFHLPIGLAYFPWCQSNRVDQTCATYGVALRHKYYRLAATLWVRWFLFTVLSGLLIGMGGPFWYDTFTRLSGLVQGVRALGAAGKQEPAPATGAPPAPFIAPPVTPAAAFRAATPPTVPPPNP